MEEAWELAVVSEGEVSTDLESVDERAEIGRRLNFLKGNVFEAIAISFSALALLVSIFNFLDTRRLTKITLDEYESKFAPIWNISLTKSGSGFIVGGDSPEKVNEILPASLENYDSGEMIFNSFLDGQTPISFDISFPTPKGTEHIIDQDFSFDLSKLEFFLVSDLHDSIDPLEGEDVFARSVPFIVTTDFVTQSQRRRISSVYTLDIFSAFNNYDGEFCKASDYNERGQKIRACRSPQISALNVSFLNHLRYPVLNDDQVKLLDSMWQVWRTARVDSYE